MECAGAYSCRLLSCSWCAAAEVAPTAETKRRQAQADPRVRAGPWAAPVQPGAAAPEATRAAPSIFLRRPNDSCARFGMTFAGDACGGTCADVSCPCDPFPVSLVGCNPDRGCLASVDCSIVCDADLGQVTACIGYLSCVSDADCNGGKCVTDVGSTEGECESGATGARCREAADCVSGYCVVSDSDGTRTCSSGQVGAACNSTNQCEQGTCALAPGGVLGFCTQGQKDEPCWQDADCLEGSSCTGSLRRRHRLPIGNVRGADGRKFRLRRVHGRQSRRRVHGRDAMRVGLLRVLGGRHVAQMHHRRSRRGLRRRRRLPIAVLRQLHLRVRGHGPAVQRIDGLFDRVLRGRHIWRNGHMYVRLLPAGKVTIVRPAIARASSLGTTAAPVQRETSEPRVTATTTVSRSSAVRVSASPETSAVRATTTRIVFRAIAFEEHAVDGSASTRSKGVTRRAGVDGLAFPSVRVTRASLLTVHTRHSSLFQPAHVVRERPRRGALWNSR